MGIFDSIKSALGFGDEENKEETQEQQEAAQAEEPQALMDQEEAPAEGSSEGGMQMEVTDAPQSTQVVDVVSKLDELSQDKPELDWKNSIVDLLELVGIDSSYENRKELAQEVGIEGYHGTAEQNIELHKKVLNKIAQNGGNIPQDLLA